MKKFFALFFSVALILLLSACSPSVPKGQVAVDLYFSNKLHTEMVSEQSHIPQKDYSSTRAFVKLIMKKLLSGPSSPELSAVIPDGVSLRGVSFEGRGVVNIDLGGSYYEKLSKSSFASDELLARYTIACTLCQHPKIQWVKFYINGESLRALGGKGEVVQPISEDGILMNSPSSVETQTEKFVTLYFTNDKAKKLFPETRKATMTDNSLEKTIVTELIRGPVTEEYVRTVPQSTKIISIETTEEVCFVNLSADFVSGTESGSFDEKLAVYSVVNALTRIPGVEKVQILIDGKKPETDKSQLFAAPLERNQKIINEANIS